MRKYVTVCILLFAGMVNCPAKNTGFATAWFKLALDEKGNVTSLFDKTENKEYLPEGKAAPLMCIRREGTIEMPSLYKKNGNTIMLQYDKSKVEAHIKVVEKPDYLSFELVKITSPEQIELVIWGPFPTGIREIIGECVGVVRNDHFALGIQALNVKTLGGYPSEENDVEPAFDIFATRDLADLSSDWKNKKHYRGQTAKAEDFGSVLQAYCRNRNKERIISNWNHDFYVAPAFNDGGVLGSKIALFGCPAKKALEVIGKIEISEKLPHPLIDGEWAKTSRSATSSYLIAGFSEQNLDEAMELAHKAGLKFLYHGGPFETWGHFILNKEAFPENWMSMKKCVDRAKAQGIKLGVHTLSNFITTNDAYVTPVPEKRLAKVGESILTGNIDEESSEILIESPRFFNQMKNNSLHSAVVGDEIIRYKEVSEREPWKLTGCVRGAYGTKASAHKEGEAIGKLMDHGYKVFLSDANLSSEIARNIARLFNETGLMQISFDGLEGVWSTGMGQHARNLFTATWFDNLSPELKGKVINDASNPAHFNWHINTRYNWGEPWYAGFRESQTAYRIMNQDFYHRNFLPAMLGWFSLSVQTSIEDIEWLLARAAGFDAGFALNVDFDAVKNNGQSDVLLNAIKNWETARMAGAFSSEQKTKMQDIKSEFHLKPVAEKEWQLFPYHVERFVHEQKIRQPGEPLYSTFEFQNPYREQPMMFILSLLPKENSSGSSIEEISIEVNNYSDLKIPVRMEPFQSLKLDDRGKMQLFDKDRNLIRTVDFTGKIPFLSQGKNTVVFDTEFLGGGNSVCKIEMKTTDQPELVKSEN